MLQKRVRTNKISEPSARKKTKDLYVFSKVIHKKLSGHVKKSPARTLKQSKDQMIEKFSLFIKRYIEYGHLLSNKSLFLKRLKYNGFRECRINFYLREAEDRQLIDEKDINQIHLLLNTKVSFNGYLCEADSKDRRPLNIVN